MSQSSSNSALPSATILAFISLASTQLGSVLAKTIVRELGSAIMVLIRSRFSGDYFCQPRVVRLFSV